MHRLASLFLLAVVFVTVYAGDGEEAVPTPPPAVTPTVQKFQLTNSTNNMTCLLAEFATKIAITYNNTDKKTVTGYLDVNGTVIGTDSNCGNSTQFTLYVNFEDQNTNSTDNEFKMRFVDGNKSHYVDYLKIKVNIAEGDDKYFPGYPKAETRTLEFVNLTLFKVADKQAYSCSSETVKSEDKNVEVTFSETKVDAFREKKADDTSYTNLQDCKPEAISDLVPIAVGCALFALVVIVLIAYFIGRRRTRRLAYQSV